MKNLYVLKQRANEWNKKFDDILQRNGYNRSVNDPCLYSKQENGEWIYLCLRIDDLIVATNEEHLIDDFETRMSRAIVIKNLGNLQYYLGLQFERDENGVCFVHHAKYTEKKLKEFTLEDSRPSDIPMDPGNLKRNEIHTDVTT